MRKLNITYQNIRIPGFRAIFLLNIPPKLAQTESLLKTALTKLPTYRLILCYKSLKTEILCWKH